MGRQSNRGKDCVVCASELSLVHFTIEEGSGRQILNGQKLRGPFLCLDPKAAPHGHNHQISFQFLVLDYMKSKGVNFLAISDSFFDQRLFVSDSLGLFHALGTFCLACRK